MMDVLKGDGGGSKNVISGKGADHGSMPQGSMSPDSMPPDSMEGAESSNSQMNDHLEHETQGADDHD